MVRLYDEVESKPKIKALGYEKGMCVLFLGYEGLAEMVALDPDKLLNRGVLGL
ncbi:MAG: hypothetical protein ACOC17_04665 [Halanaerobium sp.]